MRKLKVLNSSPFRHAHGGYRLPDQHCELLARCTLRPRARNSNCPLAGRSFSEPYGTVEPRAKWCEMVMNTGRAHIGESLLD